MPTKKFMSGKGSSTQTPTTTEVCKPPVYGHPVTAAGIMSAASGSHIYKDSSRPPTDTTGKKPEVNNTSPSTPIPAKNEAPVAPVPAGNAYTHETNNVVASPAAGSTAAATNSSSSSGNSNNTSNGRININKQFLPNILDNYDSYTYHFKLFIADPDASSEGDVLRTENQIIIAETGVTDLTIDKVEIRAIATPSIESGTGTATNVKFEIIEPSGAGLIDKIFYQSVALGIGNWAVMPVYLQLQFRARNPVDSNPDDGAPGSLASLKWLWTLKLSRIKANVTHVGTRYEFEAIVYDDFAQSNAIFTMQNTISLNNLSTVYDAFSQLQDKLNEDQFQKLINNYSIPDSFKIIVDPKIAGYRITPPNNNKNSKRNDSFDKDYKNATFQAGTTVDKIIDTLLAQTPEFQTAMTNAPTPGAEGSNMNQEPTQMKKFWRIITETRPLKFDARRQDISKEFTIFVIEYDIGILEQNVFQNSAPPITLEAQRKRLMTYAEKAILRKKYNYIFTGLNDQIHSFDITINNAFANSQARFGGIYSNPFMYDKGTVTQQNAKKEAEATAALTNAISLLNNASGKKPADIQQAEKEAREKINASTLDPDMKQRYLTLLNQAKSPNKLDYLNVVQSSGGINSNGDLNSSRLAATRLSVPITDMVSQRQLSFISDVNIKATNSKAAYTAYLENTKSKLRPIARIETLQDRQIGMGIESNSDTGLQKLSSMFAVALHSGLDSSLQKIKINIKGDPYWISPQPYTSDNAKIFNSLKAPEEALAWIKASHTKYISSVNLYGTDNFIVIRFRTPQVYQGSSLENNADDNSDVETLSGVYKVTVILCKFEGGKFSQELEGILDPEINILSIADQIEEDAKTNDKPATTDQLTQNINLPATSFKTSRLQATVTNVQGKVTAVTDQAVNSVNSVGAKLSSNIPAPIQNIITGGPPKFG